MAGEDSNGGPQVWYHGWNNPGGKHYCETKEWQSTNSMFLLGNLIEVRWEYMDGMANTCHNGYPRVDKSLLEKPAGSSV